MNHARAALSNHADIPVDLDVIGYVDPGVTVNVIKNGEIVEKKKIELPEILNGVINVPINRLTPKLGKKKLVIAAFVFFSFV